MTKLGIMLKRKLEEAEEAAAPAAGTSAIATSSQEETDGSGCSTYTTDASTPEGKIKTHLKHLSLEYSKCMFLFHLRIADVQPGYHV